MSLYMVTGAAAQVPAVVNGGGGLALVYRGALVDLSKDQAAHLLSVGLIEPVGDVADDPVVAAGDAGFGLPSVIRVRPADDASEDEWVAHAVASGMREEDARANGRDALVGIYGAGPAEVSPLVDTRPAEPAPRDPAEGGELKAPPKAAKREAWVDYRVAQGVPAEVLGEDVTKDQLQDDDFVAGLRS